MPSMTRRTLAIIALGAGAGLVFACLPELSALKSAEGSADAGDETTAVAPVDPCGDRFIDDDAGEECDIGDASTACVDCKIACPGITDDASAHCYYVSEAGVTTYQTALVSCPGGHVVTLGSERESAFVDALDAGPYWVGARVSGFGGFGAAVPTEPGFPRDGGCSGCFARPLVDSDAGDCVVATDGGWSLESCVDAGATTICEREPGGVRSFFCQGPYCATVKGVTKRYVIYLTDALTAAAAAAECANYDEGKLVVLASREERERLAQELVRLGVGVETPFEAWVGLANVGGAWTWDDGVPAEDGGRASPWGAGQPSTNAGRAFIRINPASFDSQLAQTKDDLARPFICQRK
jgi:hypothetical protein